MLVNFSICLSFSSMLENDQKGQILADKLPSLWVRSANIIGILPLRRESSDLNLSRSDIHLLGWDQELAEHQRAHNELHDWYMKSKQVNWMYSFRFRFSHISMFSRQQVWLWITSKVNYLMAITMMKNPNNLFSEISSRFSGCSVRKQEQLTNKFSISQNERQIKCVSLFIWSLCEISISILVKEVYLCWSFLL